MDFIAYELGKKSGGGSPTPPGPSSGYVEDGLCLCYMDGIYIAPNGMSVSSETEKIGFNNTDGMTIEMCAKVTGQSSDSWPRMLNIYASPYSPEFAISRDGTQFNPMMRWVGLSDYTVNVDIPSVIDSQLHTYSVVIDSTTAKCYFDGRLIDTRSTSSGYHELYGLSHIVANYNNYIVGSVYGARLYKRVLTTTELDANHANDIALYGGNT